MVDVYYARLDDYQPEIHENALSGILRPVIDLHGGISGKKVMIKPNLLEYRKENDPATVHPQLLLTLCR